MKLKNLELINPIYWPAWLGLGLLWLITRLPCRWQMNIGKFLGRTLYLFPTKFKKTTEVNVKLCFPEMTALQQKMFIKKNFASLGIGMIEAAMSWWLPDDKLKHLFNIYGMEYLEQAFAKGKGIVLLAPHFTCLEMIGRLLGMKYTFAVMYRPHKKRLIAFIHERFRKKYYSHYIASNRVRELIRTLNQNMAIWYAYDIDAGRKQGVFAPFFGIQTASLTSVTRIVNLTGAAIIPMSFFRRDDNFFYEVHLFPAIENFPTGSLAQDAALLNAALERCIRQKPEQYVWQYKRFKTRPPGETRIY